MSSKTSFTHIPRLMKAIAHGKHRRGADRDDYNGDGDVTRNPASAINPGVTDPIQIISE